MTDTKDLLTMGCAAVGAVLGVINTVTALNQRRVKLKVIPKTSLMQNGGVFSHRKGVLPNSTLSIEIINLSQFPVTIAEAGFMLKGERARAVSTLSGLNGEHWPRRLDSRQAITAYFLPGAQFPKNLWKAYATTDCEETRHGDSPALRKYRAQL